MCKCLYLRVRTHNGMRYTYCMLKRLKSTLKCEICLYCDSKEYKKAKPIKKLSEKKAIIEKDRFSRFTNDLKHCIEDNKHTGHIDKHEIFDGKNRDKSIEYGLVVPLCRVCHEHEFIKKKWQIIAKREFIRKYGEELFAREFQTSKGGKNE